MATELQYSVFRDQFEHEEQRYSSLQGKAKLYLGVASAYSTVLLLKTADVAAAVADLRISLWCFLLFGVTMSAALTFTIAAMNIGFYERPFDPETVICAYSTPPADATFLEDRIVDYSVATNANVKVNNTAATLLRVAAWLILATLIGETALLLWSAVARMSNGGLHG